jgi:hypothetical protein
MSLHAALAIDQGSTVVKIEPEADRFETGSA